MTDATNELPDGWYRVTGPDYSVDFERIVNGRCDYGNGATVADCIKWGYTFEPAVCLTVADHDDLRRQLAEKNKRVRELGNWINLKDRQMDRMSETIDEQQATIEQLERELAEEREGKAKLLTLEPDWSTAPAWAKWHTADMHGCIWWQKKPVWDGWHWGRPFSRDKIGHNDDALMYGDYIISDRNVAKTTLRKRPKEQP